MITSKLHPQGPEFPRLITGVWRWQGLSVAALHELIEASLEAGIDVIDHADIYGDHTIEENFGRALQERPEWKARLRMVTKCGIKFPSERRPGVWTKHYDTSAEHILFSAENSLRQLGVDTLELLLIHRPDPLMNPEEVAGAFTKLKAEGKVRYFGVSNFTGPQFELLQSFLDFPLVTNQIEVSLSHTTPMFDGTLDVLMRHKVSAMAWSPLGGGKLSESEHLQREAAALGVSPGALAVSWLLHHPGNLFPVVGTSKPDRLREVTAATHIQLDRQQWFNLLAKHRGFDVP